MQFDLHVHSKYSYDCKSEPNLILKVAKTKGLAGIAITDHNNVKFHISASSYETDIIVIPGIEVSTKRGHILGLGIKENIPTGLEVIETIELIKDLGGVAVIAHPFDFLRHGIGKVVYKLPKTPIETHNGATLFSFMNRKAERWANKMSWPKVGGSDAHRLKDIGLAFTEINEEIETGEELLELIEKGKTSGNGSHLSPFQKLIRTFQIHL